MSAIRYTWTSPSEFLYCGPSCGNLRVEGMLCGNLRLDGALDLRTDPRRRRQPGPLSGISISSCLYRKLSNCVSYLTCQTFCAVCRTYEGARLYAVHSATVYLGLDGAYYPSVIRDVPKKCLRDARAQSLRSFVFCCPFCC
jgi:hypothetical protein